MNIDYDFKQNIILTPLERVRTKKIINELNKIILLDNTSALVRVRARKLINELEYILLFDNIPIIDIIIAKKLIYDLNNMNLSTIIDKIKEKHNNNSLIRNIKLKKE